VSLPRLVRAAAGILEFLETKGRPACVIGGIVVSRWGEPRATTDVDLAVLAELGDEQNVLAELLSTYPSREPNPEAFASANRITLLHLPGRIHADISLAAFPFEREVLERSTDWSLSKDLSIRTCSAEDLVIYNVAGRPGDIQDVIGIVGRQRRSLDTGADPPLGPRVRRPERRSRSAAALRRRAEEGRAPRLNLAPERP